MNRALAKVSTVLIRGLALYSLPQCWVFTTGGKSELVWQVYAHSNRHYARHLPALSFTHNEVHFFPEPAQLGVMDLELPT
jgi:hypothetical protein